MTPAPLSGFIVGYSIIALAFSIHLFATYRSRSSSKILIFTSLLNTALSIWLSSRLPNDIVQGSISATFSMLSLSSLLASFVMLKITMNRVPGLS